MTVTKPQTKEAQKTLRTIILKLLHVSTHAQTAESQRRKNLPKRARMVRTAGDFSSEDTQREHSGLLPSELPFEHENASRCEWTRPARNTDGASGTRQRRSPGPTERRGAAAWRSGCSDPGRGRDGATGDPAVRGQREDCEGSPDTGAAWDAAQQCLTVPAGCLHASSANSRTTTRESFKKYNRHAKREKTKSNGQLKPERAGEQDTRSSEQKAVATVTGTDPTVATSTCVTGLNTATKSLAVRS